MAGYMTKLQGYVYDGAHIAAEELENGVFAEITADGVKKLTGADGMTLRVALGGKTTLWTKNALILDVVKAGNKEVFFVENEWEIDDTTDYNTAEYKVKAGKYVRMHRPLPGEQLIMTVGEDVYGAVAEGDTVTLVAGGTVAKA